MDLQPAVPPGAAGYGCFPPALCGYGPNPAMEGRNSGVRSGVVMVMTRRLFVALPLAAAPALRGAHPDYLSARRKLAQIETGRLKAGSRVALTPRELSAYALHEAQQAYPGAVREPSVTLGTDAGTGSALIDLGKIRRAQGKPPGWLMSQLLDGERLVRVTARLRSSGGFATVDVQSVEVDGMAIEGAMLDFLIRNYLVPNYPDAKVGEPFELRHRVEKIEVRPSAVNVVIGP